MITIGFLHGILIRVGSAFTALLNMQCWILELTETVKRNASCSFFEVVRQNMRLKLLQLTYTEIVFFFLFCFVFLIFL